MNTEKTDSRQWFLRVADKTIFGPVATPGIILWAEQGRILAGHEISNDRQKWTPAEEVPELGIAWYIDDGAGKLRGPLNRTAAETILRSGKAPAGARLIAAAAADPERVLRPTASAAAAAPATAGAEKRAANANQAAETTALQQRIGALEEELGKQKEALVQARQAAKQAAAFERERDTLVLAAAETAQNHDQSLMTLRAELESKHAAALRAYDQTLAGVREELEALRAACELARRERDAHRDEYNNLLSFSNEREQKLAAQIEALSQPRSAVELASETCASDPGGVLADIIGQEVALLENDLAQERDAMAHLRAWSARRQETLQNRIHELGRILKGGFDSGATRETGRETARIRPPDITRVQAEMETLRATHTQAMRQAEEHAAELTRKLRALENEEARLRSQIGEVDKLNRANQELADTIRRREQEMVQEHKQREIERANFAATQQALLRRIEQLERGGEVSETKPEMTAVKVALQENRSSNRSNLAPWFRLKR